MTETVWITTGATNRSTPYHSEESCQALKRTEGYRAVPLNTLNGTWDECRWCAGEVEQSNPDFSDEVRNPSQPTGKRDENVVIGEVWTASRGFVEAEVDSQEADRSFAEVRRPSLPTGRRDENVIINEVWTADRGFVEVDVESQSRSTDRSFAEVGTDD